jgi:hypothetical protein
MSEAPMPGVGIEPTRPFGPRILSPVRLPVPPPRRIFRFYVHRIITKSAIREVAAALGIGFYAAIATWLIAVAVQRPAGTALRLALAGVAS